MIFRGVQTADAIKRYASVSVHIVKHLWHTSLYITTDRENQLEMLIKLTLEHEKALNTKLSCPRVQKRR